jgi:hypothetical protein
MLAVWSLKQLSDGAKTEKPGDARLFSVKQNHQCLKSKGYLCTDRLNLVIP